MYKLQFKDSAERSVWLVGEKLTLGSHRDNDLVLEGLGINEFHAEIAIDPGTLILKSKAGSCYINELPVDSEHELHANDELRIGVQRLLIIDPKQPAQDAVKTPAAPAAAQVSAASGWKLLPKHPKLQGKNFSITSKSVIGRAKDCDLPVPYKMLSREHAELRVEGDSLLLTDLGSANGTFVNGKRVKQARVRDGDTVAFAKLAFLVEGPQLPPSGSAKADRESMNKTAMRPALNLDVSLPPVEDKSMPDISVSLEIEPGASPETEADFDYYEDDEADSAEGSKAMVWVALTALLTAAAGGAFWFFSNAA